ncbi:MAG: DUF1640 domain-containing protein [Methylococcales bacterium]|nr:MAG: DUF1640 domain-containing protein [Methylococcales bacterium]
MTTITFDTLKYAERLEKAGIPREHAKAEAEALADVLASNAQDLSTKTDIALMHSEMREMRTEINGELKLLRWMVGMSIALSTGTIALLAKLVFILPH